MSQCLREARHERHRPLEAGEGAMKLLEREQRVAAAVVRRRVVGPQRYGPVVILERRGDRAHGIFGIAEIGVSHRLRGIDAQGPANVLDAARGIAGLGKCHSEQVQCIRLRGVPGDDVPINGGGLRQLPLRVQARRVLQ